MKRILFVDDEPRVLDGLKRMLYPYRNDWEMVFVTSGTEALQLLAASEFDVLMTDVRMPQMNGIELLAEVSKRHPQVVRMVLSGTADQEMTLRSVTLAHQYLVKPCDAKTLRTKVEHALNFHRTLENPILKQIIARLHSLPSIPSVYVKLMGALQSPDVSIREVGEIIAQDLGMTAKVLQLVNSAFFGMGRHIATPAEAAVYLGIDTVKALALSVSAFSQFNAKALSFFSIEALQQHSMAVGFLARNIAKSLGQSRVAIDDAFLGGMLHDIGKLVLASNCPEQYQRVQHLAQEKAMATFEAEREIFGTSHDEVGGYLLWLWGLPDAITEIVAGHHRLTVDPELTGTPLLAVYLADGLVNAGGEHEVDRLAALGLGDHLPDWKSQRDAIVGGNRC
ncbi:MAG: two-component system response regulator [Terriglobia bacterium]|nr:MAG: two-component system response regulator [Terriglobia bacterium]